MYPQFYSHFFVIVSLWVKVFLGICASRDVVFPLCGHSQIIFTAWCSSLGFGLSGVAAVKCPRWRLHSHMCDSRRYLAPTQVGERGDASLNTS